MPFTGSHPAAVLGLTRLGLPASALVIGSVTPDLPYYLPLHVGPRYLPWWLGGATHTAWALVTLDVVLGLVAWLVWHGLLAEPALAAAPARLRRRLEGRVTPGLRGRVRDRRHLLAAAVAVAVGSATHVLWDEFTHVDRWGMRHLAPLRDDWHGLAGYRWAQYASGLFGAAALAGWLVAWWRRTQPTGPPRASRFSPAAVWAAIIGVAAVVGVGCAATAPGPREAAFLGATRGGLAGALVAAALAAAWQVSRRPWRPASGGGTDTRYH